MKPDISFFACVVVAPDGRPAILALGVGDRPSAPCVCLNKELVPQMVEDASIFATLIGVEFTVWKFTSDEDVTRQYLPSPSVN